MKILFSAVCILLLLGTTSCAVSAAGPAFQGVDFDRSESSVIHVFRPDTGRSLGFDSRIEVRVDGVVLGQLGLGGSVYAVVEPGEHRVSTRQMGVDGMTMDASVRASAGSQAYVEVQYGFPTLLIQIPASIGREAVRKTLNEGSAWLGASVSAERG